MENKIRYLRRNLRKQQTLYHYNYVNIRNLRKNLQTSKQNTYMYNNIVSTELAI